MAVAEERRLGVMEGQLCLPVSRRVQFAIKGILALLLGTFLGGVMPMLLEGIGIGWGARSELFTDQGAIGSGWFPLAIMALAAWLSLVSLFASSLARNFLQAIGFAIATFIGSVIIVPAFTKGWMFLFESLPVGSILSLIIAVPTLLVTLLLLSYLNFKNLPRRLAFVAAQPAVVCGSFDFCRRQQHGDFQPDVGSI